MWSRPVGGVVRTSGRVWLRPVGGVVRTSGRCGQDQWEVWSELVEWCGQDKKVVVRMNGRVCRD